MSYSVLTTHFSHPGLSLITKLNAKTTICSYIHRLYTSFIRSWVCNTIAVSSCHDDEAVSSRTSDCKTAYIANSCKGTIFKKSNYTCRFLSLGHLLWGYGLNLIMIKIYICLLKSLVFLSPATTESPGNSDHTPRTSSYDMCYWLNAWHRLRSLLRGQDHWPMINNIL